MYRHQIHYGDTDTDTEQVMDTDPDTPTPLIIILENHTIQCNYMCHYRGYNTCSMTDTYSTLEHA